MADRFHKRTSTSGTLVPEAIDTAGTLVPEAIDTAGTLVPEAIDTAGTSTAARFGRWVRVLASRPFRSILIALLVLLGGSAGVDAAVRGVEANPAVDNVTKAAARRAPANDEQLFVDKINELRTGLGLEPLTVHPMLVPIARDWAAHLRTQGALSHAEDLSVGVTEEWSRLGENVGVGPADQVQALFDAFVASPTHYANLVKPDYRYIGVGVVHGDDGRIWTAHRFMALVTSSGDVSTTTAPTRPTPSATPSAPSVATTALPTTQGTTTLTPGPPADGVDAASTIPSPSRPTVAPALVERIAADLSAAGL